jgi:GxxExxY protein
MDVNRLTGMVVDAAMTVHTALGPGLLESTYEKCLVYELRKRGLRVASQVSLPVLYDGMEIDAGYRLDVVVEDAVIVELKAVEKLLPVHEAQLLSYLKLSGFKAGLLINFNVAQRWDYSKSQQPLNPFASSASSAVKSKS